MTQRRINTEPYSGNNRLKALAGYIKQLTYTEMQQLAAMLQAAEFSEAVTEGDYPALLLVVAERILNEETK